MKLILKILNWIFSLFCLCVLPAYGFHIGSIVIFALGIITLPIKFFTDFRNRIPVNRFVKIGIYIVIFFIGILLLPTEDKTQKSDTNKLQVGTVVDSDGKKTENMTTTEQKTTEKITEEQTTEEQTTEVQTTEVQTTEEQTTEEQTTEEQTIEAQTTEEQTTEVQTTEEQPAEQASSSYVLNTSTGKFHRPNCSAVGRMNDSNREDYYGTRDEVINRGYEPCGKCNP